MSGLTQIVTVRDGRRLVTPLSPRSPCCSRRRWYLTAAPASAWACPAARRAPPGRPSVAATWRTNALLWSSARAASLTSPVDPNGLVVGCESPLRVPTPPTRGTLFACAGSACWRANVTGGAWCRRPCAPLATPLLLLLALPYAFFVLHPAVPVAAVLATVASVGFGASLVQQERLMALTPDELSVYALGLPSAGMLTKQGVAASLAGSVAQFTRPRRR